METGSVQVDEILGPKFCQETMVQYSQCLKLNIGVGPGKGFAPVSRLRRLEAQSLGMMNITRFDHQVFEDFFYFPTHNARYSVR
jgi:hypothetical protein